MFPYRRPWLDPNLIDQCANDFVLLVVRCFGRIDFYRTEGCSGVQIGKVAFVITGDL